MFLFHQTIRRRNQSGGVLIMALLLSMIATIGFAAWSMMLSQRARVTEHLAAGMDRRLALESSNQMAKAYFMQKALCYNSGELAGDATAAAAAATVNPTTYSQTNPPPPFIVDGATKMLYAGLTVPAWTGFPMATALTEGAHYNAFTSMGRRPFAISHSPTIYFPREARDTPNSAGGGNSSINSLNTVSELAGSGAFVESGVAYSAALKSYPPLCMDYQLMVHAPTLAPSIGNVLLTGNLDIKGTAYFFKSETSFNTVRANRVQIPFSATQPQVATKATDDSFILPSNLPTPLFTSGLIDGGGTAYPRYAPDFSGKLDVIDPGFENGNNSMNERLRAPGSAFVSLVGNTSATDSGIALDGTTGVLTVNLSTPDLKHVLVRNELTRIEITGDTAELGGAPTVFYVQDSTSTRDLSEVVFKGANNRRRCIVAVKKISTAADSLGGNLNLNFEESVPDWRLMGVFENTPIIFTRPVTASGNILLQGGIQTDSHITALSGTDRVVLRRETAPTPYLRLLPRVAWVETGLRLGTALSNGTVDPETKF